MNWRFVSTILLVGCLFTSFFFSFSASAANTSYTYYHQGSNTDVSTDTTFGQVFMSADVDDAYKWMIEKANGGDFLIIGSINGSNDSDAYNRHLSDLAKSVGKPLNSVNTLILNDPTKAGSDPFVISTIKKAEAIFFADGNQADFVQFLISSPALSALNQRIAEGIPFGGSNAGAAIQGQHIYDAIAANSPTQNSAQNLADDHSINKALDSSSALRDPYRSHISITHNLVATPVNADIHTEYRFEQNDRMGCLLTFLARNIQDGFATADQSKAIALNDQTALLVEKDGASQVVVQSGAINPGVFLAKSSESPTVCQSGSPLTFAHVSVFRLHEGSRFNLKTWTGTGVISYTLDVSNGVVTSSAGNVYGE